MYIIKRSARYHSISKKMTPYSPYRGLSGDEEDRTLDLTDANRTLSQLSYAPVIYINFVEGIQT